MNSGIKRILIFSNACVVSLTAMSACGGGGGDVNNDRGSGSSAWQASDSFVAPNLAPAMHFGYRLAMSTDGSTLAVSAPLERSDSLGINGSQEQNARSPRGAVYIYSKNPTAQWQFETYIKPSVLVRSDTEPGFGASLDLSADGKTLVVGARTFNGELDGLNETSRIEMGAVFVFGRNASGDWAETTILQPADGLALDHFGSSVAISADGSTIVAGAPDRDYGPVDGEPDRGTKLNLSGAARIFKRSSENIWTEHAFLRPAQPMNNEHFGLAVAVSSDGSVVAVTAPDDSGGGAGVTTARVAGDDTTARTGAAYVYRLAQSGYELDAYLKPQQPLRYQSFGRSIAMSETGNRIAVGGDFYAYAATLGAGLYEYPPGFIDVFEFDGNWAGTAIIAHPSPRRFSDQFGSALSLTPDGQTLAVGMSGDKYDVDTQTQREDRGAAHLFSHDGDWRHLGEFTPAASDRANNFGADLVLSNDGSTLVIGASNATVTDPAGSSGLTVAGRVYSYDKP